MKTLPLRAIKAQYVSAALDGQNVTLFLIQRDGSLFVDIWLNGVIIGASVIAHNAVALVARDYAGFSGNLMFFDTQGKDDPLYSGLGSRWQLVYFTAAEYALI